MSSRFFGVDHTRLGHHHLNADIHLNGYFLKDYGGKKTASDKELEIVVKTGDDLKSIIENSSAHQTFVLEEGTHYISEQVNWPDHRLHFVGLGNAVIDFTGSSSGYPFDGFGLYNTRLTSWKNIKFQNPSTPSVRFRTGPQWLFSDCEFEGYLYPNPYNATMVNCYLNTINAVEIWNHNDDEPPSTFVGCRFDSWLQCYSDVAVFGCVFTNLISHFGAYNVLVSNSRIYRIQCTGYYYYNRYRRLYLQNCTRINRGGDPFIYCFIVGSNPGPAPLPRIYIVGGQFWTDQPLIKIGSSDLVLNFLSISNCDITPASGSEVQLLDIDPSATNVTVNIVNLINNTGHDYKIDSSIVNDLRFAFNDGLIVV